MADDRFRERRSAFIEGDEAVAAEAASEEPAEAVVDERTTSQEPEVEEPEVEEPEVEEKELGGVFPDDLELPDASFVEIVQILALQAMQLLGEVPLNEAGERQVLPREARHFIDLISILEERTRGNLQPEEARFLEQILADLRLRYLRVGS